MAELRGNRIGPKAAWLLIGVTMLVAGVAFLVFYRGYSVAADACVTGGVFIVAYLYYQRRNPNA